MSWINCIHVLEGAGSIMDIWPSDDLKPTPKIDSWERIEKAFERTGCSMWKAVGLLEEELESQEDS